MSYEKVRSIKIKNGEVLVTGKCNNDTAPVKQWHCTYLSNVLKEHGEDVADIAILRAYEEGNFQSTSSVHNKWTAALEVLKDMPEYANFNWRNSDYEDNCPIQVARKSEGFNLILKKALNQ